MALDQPLALSGLLLVIQYNKGTGLGQDACVLSARPHPHLTSQALPVSKGSLQADPHLPGDLEGQWFYNFRKHWNQLEDPLEHRLLGLTTRVSNSACLGGAENVHF